MPQITSVALFDCPHCIDEFRFDYQRIAKLNYGWRVRVRCPGCGNVVEVVMLNYTLIHGCDPNKYKPGEITEILLFLQMERKLEMVRFLRVSRKLTGPLPIFKISATKI